MCDQLATSAVGAGGGSRDVFAIHPFSHSLSTFGMPPMSEALEAKQETKQVWVLPPGDLGPVVETVKLCEGSNCVFGSLLGSQRIYLEHLCPQIFIDWKGG